MKPMPYRLVNLDFTMLILNTTSVGTLAIHYLTEHLTGVGGFVVMLSVAFLNIAKGIKELKSKNKD